MRNLCICHLLANIVSSYLTAPNNDPVITIAPLGNFDQIHQKIVKGFFAVKKFPVLKTKTSEFIQLIACILLLNTGKKKQQQKHRRALNFCFALHHAWFSNILPFLARIRSAPQLVSSFRFVLLRRWVFFLGCFRRSRFWICIFYFFIKEFYHPVEWDIKQKVNREMN